MIATNLVVVTVCCALGVQVYGELLVQIDSGWVRGVQREGDGGAQYASFRGIPYAKQPVGELRFKELQPVEKWQDVYNATTEGPVCPQSNLMYGGILPAATMNEACIYVNVHVPIDVLSTGSKPKSDAPILVFIHGGGFNTGSGNSDLYGPEYLIRKGIILITFNYRLGPFGFLSLNSPKIPGNAGLRDMVTLLKWVQRNARAFGGDPKKVTIHGQSAGSSAVHLLTLSPATKGLFKGAIPMSGTGARSYFSTSPAYSYNLAREFINNMNITATKTEEIYNELISASLDRYLVAIQNLAVKYSDTSLVPVVESSFDGVQRILDDDPTKLIARGRGRDVALMVSYTNAECESARAALELAGHVDLIVADPKLILSPSLNYSICSADKAKRVGELVMQRYFKGTPTMDGYMQACEHTLFMYPAMKAAQWRAENGGAPAFLSQFSYKPDVNYWAEYLKLNYTGVAHFEDIFYVYRVNAILKDKQLKGNDEKMKEWMTTFYANFIRCSNPTCKRSCLDWPSEDSTCLKYQDVTTPLVYNYVSATNDQKDMVRFFDNLFDDAEREKRTECFGGH